MIKNIKNRKIKILNITYKILYPPIMKIMMSSMVQILMIKENKKFYRQINLFMQNTMRINGYTMININFSKKFRNLSLFSKNIYSIIIHAISDVKNVAWFEGFPNCLLQIKFGLGSLNEPFTNSIMKFFN